MNERNDRAKMKAYRFYYTEPGMVYAEDHRFRVPLSLAEAKAQIKEWRGLERYPRGYAIWPAQEDIVTY